MLNTLAGIIAAGSGLPPTPTSPVAGYKLWLDAADTSTITASGGAVSQWTDKSVNAYAFTQATSAYKPATGTDTQNGKNVLTWGTSDNLLGTSAASTWQFMNNNTGSTTFIAFKQTVAADSAGLLQTNGATKNETGIYIWHQATSKLQHVISRSVGGTAVADNTTGANALNTSFNYVTVIGNPADATPANRSDIRVAQGSAIKNSTNIGAINNVAPFESLRIGDYAAGGGLGLNGTLGEIIIYDSVLSAGNILLNQQYLAAKWGV